MLRIEGETVSRLWEAFQTAATAWAAYQVLTAILDNLRRK